MNQNGCLPAGIKRFLILFLLFFSCVFTCVGLSSAAHFGRVYEAPLTVTAKVSSVVTEAEDDGTAYTVFVTYTVDGITYEDIEYDVFDDFQKVPRVGATVQLNVSPEDPAQTLRDLKNIATGTLLWIFGPSAAIALLWRSLLRKRRSKGILHTPDEETIQTDLRLTVISRFCLAFWLVSALAIALMIAGYPYIFSQSCLFIAGFCLLIWLVCLLRARRDLQAVDEQNYRIIRANPPQSHSVRRYVTQEPWETATKTDARQILLRVYLSKKSPELSYNANGDAI